MVSFNPSLYKTGQQTAAVHFLSEKTGNAHFFPPVIQRQTVQDDLKEIQETGKSIINDLEQGKKDICAYFLELFRSQYAGDTTSAINRTTPQVLDILMEYEPSCGTRANYIILKPQRISQGHYKTYSHHRRDDYLNGSSSFDDFEANQWHVAIKNYLRLDPSKREEISKVGGFYNRSNDTINLPADSNFGNAVHEAVHRLSTGMVKGSMSPYLNEGITKYFPDIFLQDVGLPAGTGHNYGA